MSNKDHFYPILLTHLLLLTVIGYLRFILFPSFSTIPSETVQYSNPEYTKDYLEDVRVSRERTTKIIDLSYQSFNIILGSLISYLSSASSSSIEKVNQSKNNGTKNQQEEVIN